MSECMLCCCALIEKRKKCTNSKCQSVICTNCLIKLSEVNLSSDIIKCPFCNSEGNYIISSVDKVHFDCDIVIKNGINIFNHKFVNSKIKFKKIGDVSFCEFKDTKILGNSKFTNCKFTNIRCSDKTLSDILDNKTNVML